MLRGTLRSARRRRGSPASAHGFGGGAIEYDAIVRLDDDDENDLGDDFLFDLASRFNEGLTANIYSLDTALLAIAGGVLAISALAIDKIQALERGFGLGALIALACALVACAAGYAIGTGLPFTGISRKDGTEPKAFLQDSITSRSGVTNAKAPS